MVVLSLLMALVGEPAWAEYELASAKGDLPTLKMFYSEKELTVISATRAARSISRTPENIAVITADQIQRMNAHHLDDVLKRVPGLFVSSAGDFGSSGVTTIQGSNDNHLKVLLDGMNWNYIDSGVFQSNAIPVEIIDRIEIVKGPASSAWGSSLGGVINIITKKPGTETTPSGVVQGSYGKGDSLDCRGAAAGKVGLVDYYVYAGLQTSHDLVEGRAFDRNSFFGKLGFDPLKKVSVGVGVGYSDPYWDGGRLPSLGFEEEHDYHTRFANISVEAALTWDLDASLFAYTLGKTNTDQNETLGLGVWSDQTELLQEQRLEEDVMGAAAKIVWRFGRRHTAVFGADFETAAIEKEYENGLAFQEMGAPARLNLDGDRYLWGVYANATLVFGDVALGLGARYDDDEVSGSYFSPSIGATWQLTSNTLLRITGASGFNTPYLGASKTGGFFLDPNPDLEPEEILSSQIGIETSELEVVWLKATYFYHETRKSLEKELYAAGPPSNNDLFFNKGDILRRGVEVEAETKPFYDVAFYAGGSYVNITPSNSDGTEGKYTFNIALKYDDGQSWNAEIWGRYVWWNITSGFGGEYDDFIWDISVNKTFYAKDNLKAEVFGVVHNLFNGTQYATIDGFNPDRWAEIGLRVNF